MISIYLYIHVLWFVWSYNIYLRSHLLWTQLLTVWHKYLSKVIYFDLSYCQFDTNIFLILFDSQWRWGAHSAVIVLCLLLCFWDALPWAPTAHASWAQYTSIYILFMDICYNSHYSLLFKLNSFSHCYTTATGHQHYQVTSCCPHGSFRSWKLL